MPLFITSGFGWAMCCSLSAASLPRELVGSGGSRPWGSVGGQHWDFGIPSLGPLSEGQHPAVTMGLQTARFQVFFF